MGGALVTFNKKIFTYYFYHHEENKSAVCGIISRTER